MFARIAAAALAVATTFAVTNMSMTSTAEAARGGGGGASRGCLTGAARSLLNRIESRFGSVNVISTCRPGATIAGSGRPSRHASGNAIDFEAGGRKGEIVRWLAANHGSGGTMTYGDSSHIHVDIGSHFVSLAGGRGYASKSSSRSRVASNDSDSNDRPARRSRSVRTASNEGRASRERLPGGYMGLGAYARADGR